MQIVIDIPEESYKATCKGNMLPPDVENVVNAIKKGTPISKGHGRLGDLDELEQRIIRYVEHHAHMMDEMTLIQENFIIDGIKQTLTIIEADKAESE